MRSVQRVGQCFAAIFRFVSLGLTARRFVEVPSANGQDYERLLLRCAG